MENVTFVQLAGFVRDCARLGIDGDALRELKKCSWRAAGG